MKKTYSDPGIVHGYRSGLEEKIAAELTALGVKFGYENRKIAYTSPAKDRTYTPDINLENGVTVELKGRFVTADRQKHILLKQQHPSLDIRFVFSNSKARISKQSSTSYADWCRKYGFKFADKSIPLTWIKENKRVSAS